MKLKLPWPTQLHSARIGRFGLSDKFNFEHQPTHLAHTRAAGREEFEFESEFEFGV